MRKGLLFTLTVFVIAALCLCTVFASENVVFLSGGGTGDGSSADAPIGTLAGAYNAFGDAGGTIVLMSEYVISEKFDAPAHTGKIYWTSVYGDTDYRNSGAAIKFTGGGFRIGLRGPTEFDYLNINDTSTSGGVLAANYNDFTIGENVETLVAKKTFVIGGANIDTTVGSHAAGKTSTLDIRSGSYNLVIAFSRTVPNVSHTGTVILNMSGDATAVNCHLGTQNAANAKSGTTIFNISDNASVTGTLYLSSPTGTSTCQGSVTVNAYGNASVAAILRYLASYFPSGTRTLNYEETVSFPTPYTTYFGTVNVLESDDPDEPVEPDVPEVPEIYEVVYLSSGATGTGASASDPVGTFEDAFKHLDAAAGGTVVLVGTYAVDKNIQLPSYTGEVLITSVYGGTDYRNSGAEFVFSGEYHLAVGGPTTFDGVTLKCTNVGTAKISSIAGNFFPLTLGEDVQTVDASGANAALLYIVGGPNNDTTKGALASGESSTLTIKSGSYMGVTTFSRRIANLSHNGTMNVSISGNTYVQDVYLGSMGTAAAGGTTVFTAEDNVSVTTLYLANYTNTKTNGTVSVTLKDNAAVSALDKCADTYFVQADAKTLNVALTASVPSTADFGTVSLVDVEYVTLADCTKANLTFAGVNAIDVTSYAADGLTLPYPEALSEFTLTLTYIEGSVSTTYTYSVVEENGVAVATLVSTETFGGTVVYVKDGGSGNGFSASSPVGSIEAAHALLPSGGTVVLIGETTVSARIDLPAYTGAMTYTSVYDGVDYRTEGARLYFPSGVTVLLGGEATFKDINIHTDTYAYITAGFNPLTFDTGVNITHTEENLAKDSDETNGLRLAGGYNNTTSNVVLDKDASITLKSGFFRYVHGFSRYTGKVHYTGTANIVVEGTATVDELITGATQAEGTAANVNLTISDDACIYNVFVGGQNKTNLLTGTFNFVVNGGDVYEIDAMCIYTAKDCNSILTYDVATVPEGLVMLAEVAQFKTVQTFCERDNAHDYSAPFASEFDASVMLKKCSICNDIQFVGDLPTGSGENVVFVAEGGLGDGSHPAIPTSDLYAAFTKLKTSGGTIVIINAYTLDTNTTQKIGGAPSFFQEPLHTGNITVTSVYGGVDYRERGAKFVFDGNVDYKLGGPVTFDNIVFDATEATSKNTIAARYNPVVFGENVVMLRDMDDAYRLDLIGGYLYFRYTDFTDVEIDDDLIEMVNPARPLEINPETGDYTIDQNNITYVEREGVPTTNFFLRKDAGDSINRMFADMHALGLKRPDWISYAWRGYYAQYDGYSKQVGNIRVNYPNYDFERAHKTVLQSCSLPGSSEHHLGLACDFHDSTVSDVNPHSKYDTTAEWAWLVRNSYKYGFILRFTPKDTATTGFIYEAWHFRYVGTEHALAIANLNSNGDPVANADMLAAPEWCLEDYAGLVLGMYDLDSSVTINGGTFANVEGGSRGCDGITFTGEESVVIGEGANVMPEGKTYDVIYFSNGASGDGFTAETPVGTIEKAYALLGRDGGTLVWMNELSVGAATELPAHEGTVTITSVYGGTDYRESGAALKYTAAIRVSFNGPTVVENFKIINGQSGDHLLCANFHPLTLGDGMVLVNKDGNVANTLTVVGGANNNLSVGTLDNGETNTVTVKSGTYKQIIAFSAYNTGLSHTGTVNLNISGDTSVTSVVMGAKATGSKGGTTVMTLTDNASIDTVYLANGDNTVALNGNATIYAKGNSSIGAFNHYREDLFNEDARTIYYEESANLPASLETYFDNVKTLNEGERSGDATGDGVTNLKDVVRVLKACSDDTVEISSEADVNLDGAFTVLDVMLILKMILNG